MSNPRSSFSQLNTSNTIADGTCTRRLSRNDDSVISGPNFAFMSASVNIEALFQTRTTNHEDAKARRIQSNMSHALLSVFVPSWLDFFLSVLDRRLPVNLQPGHRR